MKHSIYGLEFCGVCRNELSEGECLRCFVFGVEPNWDERETDADRADQADLTSRAMSRELHQIDNWVASIKVFATFGLGVAVAYAAAILFTRMGG